MVGRNVEEATVEVGPGPGALHNPSLSTWKVSLSEKLLPNNFEVTLLQQKDALLNVAISIDLTVLVKFLYLLHKNTNI